MTSETTILGFSREQIAGVLCSALEGGSNSWYNIVGFVQPNIWEFESDTEHEPNNHWPQDFPLNPGGALLIENKRKAEPRKEMRLDLESVCKGLMVLKEQYPDDFQDIRVDNADARTGNVLLQCCLFGKWIYA